jgi:D-proline reductase (dithiol) PrdB
VQREIEAAGISTVSLSMIPEFTRSVGAPRIAAISYPMAHPLGAPGDREGQMAVLRATLGTLEGAREPGEVIELPFQWPERPGQVHTDPEEPPPIAKLLARRPWLVAKFLSGDIPEPEDQQTR